MAVRTERRGSGNRRAPSAVSAGASPDNLRAQGVRTRNAIVGVARELLLESGSFEFSLRAVALRAGVSISNLQYYFPTRQAVLRAVMEPVVDAYLEDLRRALDSKASPRATLDLVLQRALRDAKDPENAALWWYFASMAPTDPECARLLDEWYDTLARELAQLIRADNPEFKVADSLHAAMLLMAMSDGLSLQVGAGRRKRDYMRGIDAKFLAAADCILRGPVVGKG